MCPVLLLSNHFANQRPQLSFKYFLTQVSQNVIRYAHFSYTVSKLLLCDYYDSFISFIYYIVMVYNATLREKVYVYGIKYVYCYEKLLEYFGSRNCKDAAPIIIP
ncbi:hypothetical protein Y032_0086g1968 [Ancylostoma ceylanicum]|uniref:Uncharacterized protein n=1 Tax=Ancylostoma ceylanicum TaxID=53326 RepID=A0A016TQL8_9BILA|nr:hypothetical protein Y032_0086g1968 [Ancylostoma ceylanicum]